MTFPFERVATTGARALATWEQLKSAGRGVPVMIGDDESVGIISVHFNPEWVSYIGNRVKMSVADILAAAQRICHPEDLVAERTRQSAKARADLAQHFARDPHGLKGAKL